MPNVLADVAQILERTDKWAPDEDSMFEVERLLARGPEHGAQGARLQETAPHLDQLKWLTLTEAAAHDEPRLTAIRTAAAWSALAAAGGPVALMIGADDYGTAGVSIGLADSSAARQWMSAQAPDMIWGDGVPAGWSVLANASHAESVLTCRPTAIELAPTESHAGRVAVLAGLLSISAPGWCVVLVLYPVARDEIRATRDLVGKLRSQAARRLGRSESITDHDSSSANDPTAESVVASLGAWDDVLDDGLQSGGWRVTVYVCGDDAATLAVATAGFSWSLSAESSGAREKRVQNWDVQESVAAAPPAFGLLSSKDLGALLIPPDEAVGSLQVRRRLPGGRRTMPARRPINLGSWLGTTLPASIDVDDMAGHVFVAGITGSGKSTTTSRLLAQLWNEHDVPFLVIDPAKADYQKTSRTLRGGLTVVSGTDLRMNVLQAWPGRPVDRHIALVSTAFRAAFGMPVPVPYVASLLLEQVAADAAAGSDVTLHDAAARLDSLVAELGYKGEIEDNIRASLGLRLRLLLQPGRAERVAGTSAPTWLTDRPTLVQLSDLGDEEERAFLAAMLVLYIADAARARGESASVQHVTVIEEAHRLMPEPRSTASDEGDAGAVAARLMTQLLAEVRAYGESVIVVDQSPAAVAREVLRNTNLKLAHRIVDTDDQKSLGGALGLGDDDTQILGSLAVGRCLISSRDLVRPQSIQIPRTLFNDEEDDPLDAALYIVPPPAAPEARCHHPSDAFHHHASEAHGREAELAVALWTADGCSGDLVEMVGPIVAERHGTRPACLASVGIRRHIATLRRIGQLPDHSSVSVEAKLWSLVLQGAGSTAHPAAGRRGPFIGCAQCPTPCVARAAVASGAVSAMTKAMTAVSRSPSHQQAVKTALLHGEAIEAELAQVAAPATAMTVAYCVVVHVANRNDLDHAVLERVLQE